MALFVSSQSEIDKKLKFPSEISDLLSVKKLISKKKGMFL